MSSYSDAAVLAVRRCRSTPTVNSVAAWNAAVREVFPNSESQRQKVCPRGAFLGLCEEGRIVGVDKGNYTRSKKNKGYALRAVELLRNDSKLAAQGPAILWARVMNDETKAHNQQMEVVLALWSGEFLVKP